MHVCTLYVRVYVDVNCACVYTVCMHVDVNCACVYTVHVCVHLIKLG